MIATWAAGLLLLVPPVDAFPKGTASPEGVAADLARAFIESRVDVFDKACLQLDAKRSPAEFKYQAALALLRSEILAHAKQPAAEGDPIAIKRVYRARRLSREGPASAAYAIFDLRDLQFVDVQVELKARGVQTVRTLVVQTPGAGWKAIPRPDLLPLLSMGLNDEPESTEEVK
jgi:hypothetical protein